MVEKRVVTREEIDADTDGYGHLTNSRYAKQFLQSELEELLKSEYADYHLSIAQTWFNKEIVPADNLSIESVLRKLHGEVIILDYEKKTKKKQKRAVRIDSIFRQDNEILAVRKATYSVDYLNEEKMGPRAERIKRRASNEHRITPEVGFFQGRELKPEIYEQLFGDGAKDILKEHKLLPKDLLPDGFGLVVIYSKYSYFMGITLPEVVSKDAVMPIYFTVTSGIRFSRYTGNVYVYIDSILRANGELIGIGETRNCFVRIDGDGNKRLILKPPKYLVDRVRIGNGQEQKNQIE